MSSIGNHRIFIALNFTVFLLVTIEQASAEAARALKEKFPNLIIEASGGITEASLTSYCIENVDVISLSRLTQGYDVVDFSLKIQKDGKDPRNLPVKL